MMPSYRWNLAEKKWEKCSFEKPDYRIMAPYRDIQNDPKATHTSCQPMNFEIEEKWKTMRYLACPPQKCGEWWMPEWNALDDMKQFNPKTDRFEECRREPYNPVFPMSTAGRPNDEFSTSCSPVPKEHAEWLLEKSRAEYKIWQLHRQANPPDQPFPPDLPLPPLPEIPEQPPIPEDLPPALCKGYLRGLRGSLNGDKQFWKDVKRQSSVLPADYPDSEKISDLLNESKKLILDMENFLRAGKCTKDALAQNQTAKDKLHGEIFAELSSYLSSIHDYVEIGFCQSNLAEKVKRLTELAKKADTEDREDLEEFAAEIEEKLKEFKEKAGDFEYDAAFECREYMREVESEFSSLVRQNDRDVRRVVEDILEKELGPILQSLRQESEERRERIDQLLVQVAELRKAADQVSGAVTDIKKSAEELSQKVAVSLKALAYIEEKFETEKKEIEEAKGTLVPLVQKAIEMIGSNRCLRAVMQTRMMTEFNTMTSVNWIDNQYEELERRLNAFITACEAKDVANDDVETFIRAIEEASARNQKASCERGLTPFCDVPTHEWYYGGMFTGHRTGFITQGRPGDNVLRQDALLMILRVKGLTDRELKGECEIPKTSSVINASPYARCAVARALEKGLIVRGDVSVPVSRGEIASWIAALDLVPEITDERVKEIQSSYQDLGRGVLPEWVSAIAKLVDAKVMVGQVSPESSIWQPFDNLTRASLAVVLEQLQRL
jgi:tetratricopeptide (TPR) repeat protein